MTASFCLAGMFNRQTKGIGSVRIPMSMIMLEMAVAQNIGM